MKKFRLYFLVLMMAGIFGLLSSPSFANIQSCYLKHKYIGNYPRHKAPGWDSNVQGITHDQTHWYISQTTKLWRIPATQDLAKKVSCGKNGISCRKLSSTALSKPQSSNIAGFNHFGDLTWYPYSVNNYLFVPVEHLSSLPNPTPYKRKAPNPSVTVFQANAGMDFIDVASLGLTNSLCESPKDALTSRCNQTSAGWIAVDGFGYLYSSSGTSADGEHTNTIRKYRINWQRLNNPTLPNNQRLEILDMWIIPLLDGRGRPMELPFPQGGVFYKNDLLYMTNGDQETNCAQCGIHVFRLGLQGSNRPCGSAPGEVDPKNWTGC